jgi:fatty-acyl-CoA synthase
MPLLLGDVVRRQARWRPERTAYVVGPRRVTYAQLNTLANRFAHLLRGLGVERGDRVATLAGNRLEYPAIYFAAAKLGAVHVPLNTRWQSGEVRYGLAHSEARVLLVARDFEDMARALRAELPALRHLVPLDGDGPESAATLLARASDAEPAGAVDERDPHVMLYTSGTTGEPKGALLSQRSYVLQAAQTQGAAGLGEDAVGLCMFPMFHMGGWAMPLGYWVHGGAVILLERVDPEEILRLVARERVTYLYLIPTLYRALLALPAFDGADLSSLRALGSGTTVMTATQVREIVERFRNPNLFVMYGQTEAGPIATLRPPDVLRKPTSVGRPVLNVDVRLVRGDGRDAGPDELGEIACRSEFTMLGYWRMPEATAETLRDGWVSTGDLGTLDDEGFLHIAGRVREMIKTGGENVYPAEVERCLLDHPAIAEAAVFGVPDPQWGEAVVAAVVPREGAVPDPDDVIAYVRGRLAGYKKPRGVMVLDALPRTASTSQVQKALLRERWTLGREVGR